jgi:hypothetical protein
MIKQTMGKLTRSKISERLIGIGDSHLDNFSFFCAATCRVPGATAYGLVNPNSDTRAREAFLGLLNAYPNHLPLLCIGEVDCNSLPWRTVNTERPSNFIHRSIDNLFYFLLETKRKFILPSVTLPPIESYKNLEIRSHVTANKQERTNLVHLYNRLLRETAEKLGHHYLDITTPTTGPDGLVNNSYIRSSSDVHLAADKLYPIALNLLNEVAL